MFLTELLNPYRFAAAPEDGSGGGDTFFSASSASTEGSGSEGARAASTQEGAGETAGAGEGASDRPDWLLPKYNSVEDQAKAYRELYGQYSKKTDMLKAEVAEEWKANLAKELGVPDDPEGYAYPENMMPPAENVDQALRAWAKENNVSGEAFQKLIGEVYAQTLTNFELEKGKLGRDADARVEALNRWIGKNIDEKHYGVIAKTMASAEGVEFMEGIMEVMRDAGYAPESPVDSATKPLTREQIREMQADPRFGEDPAYTQMVRNHWKAYAEREARSGKR